MTSTMFCCVCGDDYRKDEGWVRGQFNDHPVALCFWCQGSILEMIGAKEEGGFYEEKTND